MKTHDDLLNGTLKYLKPIPKMSVSEWSDSYRILSQGSAEPGRWRTSRAKYQKEIMDAFTQNGIKRVVVKSCSQIGKALSIETPIMTPDGFKLMGELEVGDKVFDEGGQICNVVAVTGIMYNRPCYEVTFSDGAKITADANHQWIADGRLLTTVQLRKDMFLPLIRPPAPIYRLIRWIVDVKKVESVPVKCIEVDSASHLYLAGKNLIPTHNSDIILNVVARFAMLDPCNIMIVQPTLELAGDFSRSRVAPMIRDTKVLTPLFYEKEKTRDSNQTILSKSFKGGRLVFVGANSPAGLAGRPIRLLLCDEIDRFPQSSGEEGDPIDLAAKRQSTYWNAITGIFSTPTNEGASRIDLEYQAGTQEVWTHQCPNCKEYQIMDYRQMMVDYAEQKDEAGNKVILVKSVKWRCPDCGFEFSEVEMKRTLQRYEVQNPEALTNGVRSFWVNGFSSPWLTWKEIMREYLEAQGMPTREAVVVNTRFGLSYRLQGEYDDEKVFMDRREMYDAELPKGVLVLTAAVDVQKNRLEYEISGWGAEESRYGILRGVVMGEPTDIGTWQELDEILDKEYTFANNKALKVARTFVDSGYSTQAVYEYCAKNLAKQRFPIKGKGGAGLPLLYQYSNVKNLSIPLIILGVDDGKQEIYSRLGIDDPKQAQYLHFPRDDVYLRRGYDSLYFKQLIAERRVTKVVGGVVQTAWQPITRDRRNEGLDLAVYNLACLRSLIGQSDAAAFWKRRYELLYKENVVKPKKPAAQVTFSRSLSIWN